MAYETAFEKGMALGHGAGSLVERLINAPKERQEKKIGEQLAYVMKYGGETFEKDIPDLKDRQWLLENRPSLVNVFWKTPKIEPTKMTTEGVYGPPTEAGELPKAEVAKTPEEIVAEEKAFPIEKRKTMEGELPRQERLAKEEVTTEAESLRQKEFISFKQASMYVRKYNPVLADEILENKVDVRVDMLKAVIQAESMMQRTTALGEIKKEIETKKGTKEEKKATEVIAKEEKAKIAAAEKEAKRLEEERRKIRTKIRDTWNNKSEEIRKSEINAVNQIKSYLDSGGTLKSALHLIRYLYNPWGPGGYKNYIVSKEALKKENIPGVENYDQIVSDIKAGKFEEEPKSAITPEAKPKRTYRGVEIE